MFFTNVRGVFGEFFIVFSLIINYLIKKYI